VDNAHRLGLSQLHQLRGRVGRSPRRAYAYFTYPKSKTLTAVQRKRLEAIREYAEFGAGFRIALRDLELRGAGNLLGAQQHGHLDAIGYDLYVKLLERAVLEEKGETVAEKPECIVNLSFDACLPERYVKSPTQRMSLYKRISLIATQYDLDDMTDELLDRYGDLPQAAANLLEIAHIRSLAQNAGITQLRQNGTELFIVAPELNVKVWMMLADEFKGKMRMMMSDNPTIRFRMEKGKKGLEELKTLFLRYGEIAGDKAENSNE
jgi:transcription-repair coupling factor (superfamily II helicase)